MTRPIARGTVTPHNSILCEMIDWVVRKTLSVTLPVCKTTPNVVVNQEGSIPSARIILESDRIRLPARYNSLDNRHSLRSWASTCPNVGTLKHKAHAQLSNRLEQMSRVQQIYRQLLQA